MPPYHIVIDNNFWDINFQTIVSISLLIASLVIAYKANKTAQESVEKTIQANREEMREETLIHLRKEWIQEFSRISSEVFKIMSRQAYLKLFKEVKEEEIVNHSDDIQQLNFQLNLLRLKIKIDGERLTEITACLNSYIRGLSYKFFLQCSEEQKTQEELEKIFELTEQIKYEAGKFDKLSIEIVESEIKKINS